MQIFILIKGVTMLKKKLQGNFTIADNRIMQCDKLSFEARGLYFYMLSLPSDWEFSEARLAKNGNMGLEKCKRILKELFNIGLLSRDFYYNDKGHKKSIYTLYDFETMLNPTKENPTKENPTKENPMYNKELNINKEKKETKKDIKTNIKATETEKSALSVKANENAKSHILQSIFSLDLFLPSDNISQADLNYLARYSHLVSKELKYIRELALFILHRKDIKKPLTERALKSILEKLKGFKEPKQALENSIMNGWSGVFENTKPTSKDDFIAKSHNTFDNGDNSLYFRDDGE